MSFNQSENELREALIEVVHDFHDRVAESGFADGDEIEVWQYPPQVRPEDVVPLAVVARRCGGKMLFEWRTLLPIEEGKSLRMSYGEVTKEETWEKGEHGAVLQFQFDDASNVRDIHLEEPRDDARGTSWRKPALLAAIITLCAGIGLFIASTFWDAPSFPTVANPDGFLVVKSEGVEIVREGKTYALPIGIHGYSTSSDIIKSPPGGHEAHSLADEKMSDETRLLLSQYPRANANSASLSSSTSLLSPVGKTRLQYPIITWKPREGKAVSIRLVDEFGNVLFERKQVGSPLHLADLRPPIELDPGAEYELTFGELGPSGVPRWDTESTSFDTLEPLAPPPKTNAEILGQLWNSVRLGPGGDAALGDIEGLAALLPERVKVTEGVLRLRLVAARNSPGRYKVLRQEFEHLYRDIPRPPRKKEAPPGTSSLPAPPSRDLEAETVLAHQNIRIDWVGRPGEALKLSEAIAASHMDDGDYQAAIKIFNEIWKQAPDARRDIADDYGDAYLEDGQYQNSLRIFREAVDLERKQGTEDEVLYAMCRNVELAAMLEKNGVVAAILEEAEQIMQSVDTDHEEYRDMLDSLGLMFSLSSTLGEQEERASRLEKAESYYSKAANLAENLADPEEIFIAYQSFGDFLSEQFRHEEAVVWYQKAAEVSENNPRMFSEWGEELFLLNYVLYKEMGSSYQRIGKMDEADSAYSKAYAAIEGKGVEYEPAILQHLAMLHKDMANYSKALPYMQRAYELTKQIDGEGSVEAGQMARYLAYIVGDLNDFSRCRTLLKECLSISAKTYGKDSPEYILPLGDMATLHSKMGDHMAAAETMAESVQLFREHIPLTPQNKEFFATMLSNYGIALGMICSKMEDQGDELLTQEMFQKSFDAFQESLKLRPAATRYHNLGVYYLNAGGKRSEARQCFEQALTLHKENTIDWAGTLYAFAFLEIEEGSKQAAKRALAFARKKLSFDEEQRNRLLQLESHQLQLAGRSIQYSYNILGTLGEPAVQDLAEFVLNDKGVVTELLLTQANPEEAVLPERVRVKDIQQALPEGAVLLEFISYMHYRPGWSGSNRVGVVLLSKHADPIWISFDNLEEPLFSLLRPLWRGNRDPSNTSMKTKARDLGRILWDPIEDHLESLGDVDRVYVSTEGLTGFVPFAVLLDQQERFLGERYLFSYLMTGRDVLRTLEMPTRLDPTIFAIPDQSAPLSHLSNPASTSHPDSTMIDPVDRYAIAALSFSNNLSHLSWKADAVPLDNVSTFLKTEATEENLRKLDSPSLLHIVAHGFSLEQEDSKDDHLGWSFVQSSKASSNPRHRSGLILAGADHTLAQWRSSDAIVLSSPVDGILLADEASQLHIENTWLVSLIACEGGLGQALPGEGVLGLRGSFLQAGADHVLSSLWTLDYKEASEFLGSFYRRIGDKDAPTAFSMLQKERLAKYREDGQFAQAILTIGPYHLTSRGMEPEAQ